MSTQRQPLSAAPIASGAISSAYISGASRGLGRALALRLARPGVLLALQARGADALHAVAAEAEALGATVLPLLDDAGDRRPGAAAALAARILEGIGTPQLVVLNASTLGPVPMPLLLDLDDDALTRVFEVNLLGPARLARRLLPAMLLAGHGSLVTISSDAAVEAWPTWGPYGASKAALDHLARSWSAELDGTGLQVLAVDPGEMDTVMHADALPDADPKTLLQPDEVAQRLLALVTGPPLDVVRVSLESLRGAA